MLCIYIYIYTSIYESTRAQPHGCQDHPSGIWEMVLCLMLSSWYTYLDAANQHSFAGVCSGAHEENHEPLKG